LTHTVEDAAAYAMREPRCLTNNPPTWSCQCILSGDSCATLFQVQQ